MYRLNVLLLALVVVGAFAANITPRHLTPLDGRIVGGEDTSIEKFPYQVSVRYRGSHMCGGSIYTSRVVITAAHCISRFSLASRYSVMYGSTEVNSNTNIIQAERVVRNENYDSNTVDNDIALVFLYSDISYSSMAQPIALAKTTPRSGTAAVVTGWGALAEDGDSPIILQKVDLAIVGSAECQEQYKDLYELTPVMLCAGVPKGGKDSCQGDSGGPLVANDELVGVVSWGMGCAREEYSGVYTNVAKLRSWIESRVN